MKIRRYVRLYHEVEGEYRDLEYDCEVGEDLPAMPMVGDHILDPGVLGGLDRSEPENRTVYEVVARYFLPTLHSHNDERWTHTVLVVRIGKGTERERNIISGH